ncbi:tRNA-2-methylthio-N(6)-dimethylallyladenosine synthase [Methylacidimicrobium cyclopophantes]|uniref:tRNA-2-methylthio-N(6)-dimethylallyladenosine synthase n=1 Tax=Methylacidimicrobium cyclopophantes TaxID=1041766 RepID=A0A5E6MN70_9BACT|nr:tRNA (N6-isopentenyl adenosine(37)-C2)-methylthiotransferase MiaB [Methylacidimicrobium cyclopophantes]VVM07473.1 tRNA-2-methylthio-N(6)-dimethylallyladenosine synthase [Methylacidimicrobium cyclopophantes]
MEETERENLAAPAVFVKTYGCQMNVRDSEAVLHRFVERGYRIASSEEEADVILLNTCSVREMAEEKACGKMAALRARKRQNPQLILGFLGCMAQRRGASLLSDFPEVDLVLGTQKLHEAMARVEGIRAARASASPDSRAEAFRVLDIGAEAGSQNQIRDHLVSSRKRSAFVSIMQGCNMRCAFCIVPVTRGPERARPMEEIEEEVRKLVDQGVREVTLLGQIVNLYGRRELPVRQGRSPFVQLLERLCAIPGIARVRFTSPHPIGFRDDLIAALRDLPPLCEHVHLPLQSGSDRILRAMGRGYTRSRYCALVEKIRSALPETTLTTDIIVGFPGEEEEDFAQTRSLLEAIQFDQAFIFRYSPRPGTAAATQSDSIPEEEKLRRNHELLAIQDAIALGKAKRLLHREVEILVEGESRKSPHRFQGRTRGNHLVLVRAEERWRGELLPVRIVETTGYTFYAEPVLAHEGEQRPSSILTPPPLGR